MLIVLTGASLTYGQQDPNPDGTYSSYLVDNSLVLTGDAESYWASRLIGSIDNPYGGGLGIVMRHQQSPAEPVRGMYINQYGHVTFGDTDESSYFSSVLHHDYVGSRYCVEIGTSMARLTDPNSAKMINGYPSHEYAGSLKTYGEINAPEYGSSNPDGSKRDGIKIVGSRIYYDNDNNSTSYLDLNTEQFTGPVGWNGDISMSGDLLMNKNGIADAEFITFKNPHSSVSTHTISSLDNGGLRIDSRNSFILFDNTSISISGGADSFPVEGATATIDGRVYISQPLGEEHGLDGVDGNDNGVVDLTHENLTNFTLFVQEGMVANDIAIHDLSQTADFVFEEAYELPSLYEVEEFIQENGHLPNVESAKASEERGLISLADRSTGTLQTVEELMLHTIQQQKTIDSQQKTIDLLLKRLEKLEEGK